MESVTTSLSLIDVQHLANSRVIAAGVLDVGDGLAIVDPGPAITLPTLLGSLQAAGAGIEDVRALILTHIHLDHAGASGTLVRAQPNIEVLVHERGAPHLSDPTKLLASATRLYGTAMERLWGPVLPVPTDNLRPLTGDQIVTVGSAKLEVAYTPGHASHHVSYLDRRDGTAFVGDVAGIRIQGLDYVFAPTPPPDINVEEWNDSLDRIAQWRPSRLFLTHFGTSTDVAFHLAEIRQRLHRWADWVRTSLTRGLADTACAAEFAGMIGSDLRRHLTEQEARRFEQGAAPQLCWYGLARYWRKREAD